MQKFYARLLDTIIDEYFTTIVEAVCQHDALMMLEKEWPDFPVQDLYIKEEE